MKKPEVDIGNCVLCGICVGIDPNIFKLNVSGYIEVNENIDYLSEKSISNVDEAVKHCPSHCISWTQT